MSKLTESLTGGSTKHPRRGVAADGVPLTPQGGPGVAASAKGSTR